MKLSAAFQRVLDFRTAVVPFGLGLMATLLLLALHKFVGLIPKQFPTISWYPHLEIDNSATLTALGLRARVSAGLSIAGLWCISICCVAASIWAVRTTFPTIDRRRFDLWACLCLIAIVLLGWLIEHFQLFIGSEVSGGLSRGVRLSSGIPLGSITSIGNVIGFTAAVCLGVAFLVILRPSRSEPQEAFARRLDALRLLLYAGASILVMGTLEVLALFRWPACEIADERQVRAVLDMASTMATGAGGAGTIILLSLYVPTVVILSARAREIAQAALPDGTRQSQDQWLSERGLLPNVGQRVREVVAVAAPIIAGAGISPVLSHLAGSA